MAVPLWLIAQGASIGMNYKIKEMEYKGENPYKFKQS